MPELSCLPSRRARGADPPVSDEMFIRALYQQHGSVLLRFAAKLLNGDWHRAEDVVQETALRAWRHAAVLDPTAESLRPWLFTVVRHLVIDGHRALLVRPPELGDSEMVDLPVPDEIERALTAQVLLEGMAELPPLQREVLVHMYYLGRSVTQTAKELGVPPGTVKSRSYYAMRVLREALRSRGVTAG